jgi:hypothetical protein
LLVKTDSKKDSKGLWAELKEGVKPPIEKLLDFDEIKKSKEIV